MSGVVPGKNHSSFLEKVKSTAAYGFFPFVKAFQRDLASRQKTYNSVVKSGRQCVEEQKVEDPEALAETLDDLVARWDALSMMSNTKQERLENALTLAEEFESGVKEELKTLKGIDSRLRSFGPVADNIDGVNKQIEEMEVE